MSKSKTTWSTRESDHPDNTARIPPRWFVLSTATNATSNGPHQARKRRSNTSRVHRIACDIAENTDLANDQGETLLRDNTGDL
jgi:hypothetical protein